MKKAIPTIACALFLTAGIAQAQVVVRIGPPARPHERIPPPSPEHRDWAWHARYHRRDGNRYLWVPERMSSPRAPSARWVPGRWVHPGGGWVWIEGHWR
jgi:hypothetical protein